MSNKIQRRALESLLAEDDPKTKELVVEQLCANLTEKYKAVMQELAQSTDDRVREGALKVLSRWGCQDSKLKLFLQAIRQNQLVSWEDLERFSWDLCELGQGGLNRRNGVEYLDGLAQRVKRYAGNSSSTEQQIVALKQVLAKEEGFYGNVNNYYSPNNSYLEAVLFSRRGLPLTLSLIYIFVARRLGWEAYGIATPSHYLAAVDKVICDPFHGGVLLNDAAVMIHYKIANPGYYCSSAFFKTTPFETAKRMMANLVKAYALVENEANCKRINACLEELLVTRKFSESFC